MPTGCGEDAWGFLATVFRGLRPPTPPGSPPGKTALRAFLIRRCLGNRQSNEAAVCLAVLVGMKHLTGVGHAVSRDEQQPLGRWITCPFASSHRYDCSTDRINRLRPQGATSIDPSLHSRVIQPSAIKVDATGGQPAEVGIAESGIDPEQDLRTQYRRTCIENAADLARLKMEPATAGSGAGENPSLWSPELFPEPDRLLDQLVFVCKREDAPGVPDTVVERGGVHATPQKLTERTEILPGYRSHRSCSAEVGHHQFTVPVVLHERRRLDVPRLPLPLLGREELVGESGDRQLVGTADARCLAGVKALAVPVVSLEGRFGISDGPEIEELAADLLAELARRVGGQRERRVGLSHRGRPPLRPDCRRPFPAARGEGYSGGGRDLQSPRAADPRTVRRSGGPDTLGDHGIALEDTDRL